MTLTVEIEMEPVRGRYINTRHWNDLFDQVARRIPGVLRFDEGKVELRIIKVTPKIKKNRRANDPAP